jgi:predicted transglutaminase-like cysteine proteinase
MQETRQTFRTRSKLPVWLGAACLLSSINPAPAHAYLSSAAYGAVFGCSGQFTPQPVVSPLSIGEAKASAILGGQRSALDLISAQQAGDASAALSYTAEPAPSEALPAAQPCPLGAIAQTTNFQTPFAQAQNPDDFLGSSRVSIGSTPLDRAWRRVSRKSGSVSGIDLIARQGQDTDLAHVAKVNAWVNRNVQFADDRALYGRADYWATAGETLRRMKGDCEDFAILKYQFLLNAGFDPGALHLTLVFDPVRRRDHAVLIVKLNGTHYLLDNQSDQVMPADTSHEYTARMSFNDQSAWLHGFTARPDGGQIATLRRIAYFSDSAVSNARVTGLSR